MRWVLLSQRTQKSFYLLRKLADPEQLQTNNYIKRLAVPYHALSHGLGNPLEEPGSES
jgi:hypothetical protein